MEFCFSGWYVLLSHKTAWMRVVPRPSLPTRTGTSVSRAASTILDPRFYTPGRNPSQEIQPALFLPTQPVGKSSVFIKMIWLPEATWTKAFGEGQTRWATSHTREETTATSAATDLLMPSWSCNNRKKLSPRAPREAKLKGKTALASPKLER